MSDSSRSVPRGRVRRFGKFARLAGGVAGNMLAEGAKQVASGQRPKARDLLLTPANARRLTRQLSEMRGAAMKLGQILSMDRIWPSFIAKFSPWTAVISCPESS